ncbi:hypothetical protein SUGI_0288000 [Cryptomeria japonica]|uniref:ultraviolet-B receptor UVR8 n=1 Tax=Cryptomeria japonica TaxID=3369 RepID=UPI0024089A5E|nr:ultraviolet-B receptor UVR8 [Cryptomeria japonica]GLJ16737.1 hypothetical protein SUGI_0288000 [Cryptomeria japonica]
MADRLGSLQELPIHLIQEILSNGQLSAADLARLEASCYAFRESYGFLPSRFKSMPELAAFQSCLADTMFFAMSLASRTELLNRCGSNWKLVLRFLQSVRQAFGSVETPKGNVQVTTGKYHTLLVEDGSLYNCGSSICGVLGHGPEITQCGSLTRLPLGLTVTHVSGSHNHAALVTQSGEVFTWGDNSSFCCGHGEVGCVIFRPTKIEALKGIICKQVATGLSYTVILTKYGQVYTCGSNSHGQLGHGDTLERTTPRKVERFNSLGPVLQIAAGVSHTMAVTEDGTLYTFGSGSNFCLGHGDPRDEFQPRAVQAFKRKNIHVIRVSAGDEHSVALDSNGYVYTWGKGYCGALGHGDEVDKTTPELLTGIKEHRAVQVCARKRKTFVLSDDGLVFAFGWMGFGSLGFVDRGISDKVVSPLVLETLKGYHISQISTGLYHTVAVTNKGLIFGFGDNERAQLGQESLRQCLEPREIKMWDVLEGPDIVLESL